MRRTPEHDEQAALFAWARIWANHGTHAIPALRTLHASLNGVKLTPGQAKKAKAAGMLSGVWDVFLPVVSSEAYWPAGAGETITGNLPRRAIGGLWIEMKAGKNTLTPEQKAFQSAAGGCYHWRVCTSWDVAARVILNYLYIPAVHPAWQGLIPPEPKGEQATVTVVVEEL